MANQDLFHDLQEKFASHILLAEEPYGLPTLEIQREGLLPIVEWLKSEGQGFMFMTDLCGTHHPGEKNRELGMTYLFHHWRTNEKIRLKIRFPESDPHVHSLTGLYKAANWMERETFDFFGIRFQGHPDLRRIMNVEEMDYHPLRKEYALEDGTRTDKDDRYFGREGNFEIKFDKRP